LLSFNAALENFCQIKSNQIKSNLFEAQNMKETKQMKNKK